jgi:precorrin-3B methylase
MSAVAPAQAPMAQAVMRQELQRARRQLQLYRRAAAMVAHRPGGDAVIVSVDGVGHLIFQADTATRHGQFQFQIMAAFAAVLAAAEAADDV